MKSALKIAILFAINLNASSFEEQLQKLIKEKTSQDVKVLKVENLKATKDVKFVLVQTEQLQVPLFASSDGGVIFGASNVFFSKNDDDVIEVSNSIKQAQNATQKPATEKIISLFSELKTSEFIVLNSQAKTNKITYIVADPNCPSCQHEMRDIKNRLKDSHVYVLPVGFLGADSVLKAAMVKVREAEFKTNEEKILFLQEVYKSGYKLPSKYQNLDVSSVMSINHKVTQSGITSVPYIYEKLK